MIMMSSVQPFSALGDPMNKGSPLMSTLHQLSRFFQSVSCFCKDALHPSHPLSASPPSTTNLPQHKERKNKESQLLRTKTSEKNWFTLQPISHGEGINH